MLVKFCLISYFLTVFSREKKRYSEIGILDALFVHFTIENLASEPKSFNSKFPGGMSVSEFSLKAV